MMRRIKALETALADAHLDLAIERATIREHVLRGLAIIYLRFFHAEPIVIAEGLLACVSRSA